MSRDRLGLGAVVAASILAALALAACGSSDNNSQDDQDISAVITRAATSGDPAACTDSQTQRFTDQTSGDQGPGAAAVKSCEQNAADSVSDSAKTTNIEVDGDKATAEATFTGGAVDGQTLKLDLVKEDGKWKVDQLTGFVNFNRQAFNASFESQIATDSSIPAQVVGCIKQQVEGATDEQLQAVFLNPSGGNQLFSACVGGQTG
jgi:hypothetical protein